MTNMVNSASAAASPKKAASAMLTAYANATDAPNKVYLALAQYVVLSTLHGYLRCMRLPAYVHRMLLSTPNTVDHIPHWR